MGNPILTSSQQRLLDRAATDKTIVTDFYLTGGTALSAFYFHHRISEDLDFFSENELNLKRIQTWATNTKKSLKISRLEQQSLHGQYIYFFTFPDASIVKVDFAYFPFSHIGTFTKYKSLRIASIQDIAVNKLQALIARKRTRDYLDLFYCLRHERVSVSDLAKQYQQKFDSYLSPEQLSTMCTNVLDASDQSRFLGDIPWKEIQMYYLHEGKRIASQLLTD